LEQVHKASAVAETPIQRDPECPYFGLLASLTFSAKSAFYATRQIRLVAVAVPEDTGLRFPVAAT